METRADEKPGDYWKRHILAARDFEGSESEYCRVNGLSATRYRSYKRRLGLTPGKRRRRREFIRIEPTVGASLPLPEARWLADFLIRYQQKR